MAPAPVAAFAVTRTVEAEFWIAALDPDCAMQIPVVPAVSLDCVVQNRFGMPVSPIVKLAAAVIVAVIR